MSTLVCTTVQCSQGRASVEQMQATFDSLKTNPQFNVGSFEPTVLSIKQSFDASYSVIDEWIPFNPNCCAIKDIGAQADLLTSRMLASVGSASPGTGPGSSSDGLGWVVFAIAFGVAYLVLGPSQKWKRFI